VKLLKDFVLVVAYITTKKSWIS